MNDVENEVVDAALSEKESFIQIMTIH